MATTSNRNYVAYYRVSTKQQGLGLEAQRSIVSAYVAANGGCIVEEYSEKESGKETLHRTQLQLALASCIKEGKTLIVAKLDRLSRDVQDIFALKKRKGLTFEVCNMDAADTMMLGIFATLAQKERELISQRTKEALKALKEKGQKLGNPNLVNHTTEGMALHQANLQRMADTHRTKANDNEANRKAYAAIRFMDGTLRAKAAYLNEIGFTTPTGKTWNAMQVQRLIKRYAA